MRKIATMLLVVSSGIMTALANNPRCNNRRQEYNAATGTCTDCNDRQEYVINTGQCRNCATYQRAQRSSGLANVYCAEDPCNSSTQIVLTDGRCSTCAPGTVPAAKQQGRNFSTSCVNSANAPNQCNGCLQFRDANNVCQTCTGQFVPNFSKTACTQRRNCLSGQSYDSCNQCVTTFTPSNNVNTNCGCDKEYNANAGQCVTCPPGQTSDNNSNKCQAKLNNCYQSNRVQGTQQQCYACQSCLAGQTYNAQTRSCQNTVVQRPTCSCYQYYNQPDNRCYSCPQGQLSNNNQNYQSGTCQTQIDSCHQNRQVRGLQSQCYQCQPCPFGQIYNDQTRSCQPQVVRPTCSCSQQYDQVSNSCQNCPIGQTSGNNAQYQDGRCANAPRDCNQRGLVQGDQSQCYQCSSCPQGQIFNQNQRRCVPQIVRPQCACYQEYDQGSNSCRQCPQYQLSGNTQFNQVGRCNAQNASRDCNSRGLVQLDQNQCYQCQPCSQGQQLDIRSNTCITPIVRPQCACYQQYDQRNNQCVDCPSGQLSENTQFSQDNTCRVYSQTCGARGLRQLGQLQCFQCQACPQGQQYNARDNTCFTPIVRPQCACYQQYDQRNNQCVDCPNGQLSGNTQFNQDNTCRVYPQNCYNSNQIQLGQQQCYTCQSCTGGQTFDRATRQCVTPRPTCNCYQQYDQRTNSCLNCPIGQISGNGQGTQSNVCRVDPQNCNANGQVQLGQQQCYRCQPCQAGRTLVGNNCQVPKPVCACYQQYNSQTNQCDNCPVGQLSGNTNLNQNGRCTVDSQNCGASNSIQLSQQQCYACRPCNAGQIVVNNRCTVRPTCACYQQYNSQTNRCDNCPVGQLRDANTNRCTLFNQACNANGRQQLSQQQCYQCLACPAGQQLVGNECRVPRPVCGCNQQYNSRTNQCDTCPAGQLSNNSPGSQDNRCQAYPQQCNRNNAVQLGQDTCYQCQPCAAGEVVYNNRCVLRPTCQCFQTVNLATNQCQNCPVGQLAINQGQCQTVNQQCNRNGEIQLPQQQCYQCRPCPVGQVLRGNQCITPRPTCRCFEFVNSNNLCESCPAGQLSGPNNTGCVNRVNQCNTGLQIQGSQQNCYQCITCQNNEIPNAQRTACVPRPFVNCGCLSKRDNTGYQCIPCPVGQVADPNNLNQCIAQPVCSQLSIRLPRDSRNCGRCQQCNFPSQIPDQTRTRCLTRPKANCNCIEKRSNDGYTCISCPVGMIRDVSDPNQQRCVNTRGCNTGNSIQLAIDQVSCGRCQVCPLNQIPDITRTSCVPRPLAQCNDCTTRQSPDGYSCQPCPAGQVQSTDNVKQCYTPVCNGKYQIRTTIDNFMCGRCDTCSYPSQLPNAARTMCINRQVAQCPCTQKQSIDGYDCEQCPRGQVQNTLNSKECIVPTCLGQYDIILPINANTCGRCQACEWPRQIPNNSRTQCVVRPFAQCPDCTTSRSVDGYSCVPCPVGQVQDPTNMSKCINRTCGGQYQIQLPYDNQSCGRCKNCQWPAFMPDQFRTTCIERPKANCGCRERQSPDGYTCQQCPTGTIQSSTNPKACVRPQCTGKYQIQLKIDEITCGACDTCQWPQFMPNTSRTQCMPRPLADCNCLSRRSDLGYSCERCPTGQVQDPNNLYACYTPQCDGTYQVRRPIDATQCGRCRDCEWPRYIPNNQRTDCVLRPLAKCNCLEKQSQDGYSCEQCQYGFRQDPRNVKNCIAAPTCSSGNQIVGLRDTQSCYACRTCIAPQIPRPDRSECYRPRPTCSCTERYSADGYSCLPCPAGQISDNSRQQCYQAPECYEPRQILGAASNCYQCRNCPANLVPDTNRRTCVRPIPVCSCTQRYSADGYECQECGARQIVDPNNNKRCIPRVCNQRNQIFSTRDYCWNCDVCPQGYEPNPSRSECVRIKPTCSCTEIYDSSGYVCVPCPPYQVATNGNQRCVPRQCSGLNEILGAADQCYACKQCQKGSTPDNLRRRCLRYITTSCTCNQRFDDSGFFGCVDCPAGTRPSLDNKSCVSLNCDKDQILRRDLLCPQCEWCPPGSIPDPKRENCIVKPRPPITVNGKPACDEFSVFNMDRSECIKCPNNLKASKDNLRCLNSCTDPLDIVQEDGSCFTCCNGNVPNYSRTRCVKKNTGTTTCSGDREIFSSDRSRCTACDPYTRAQRQNTVCLSDQCGANQIITWLGTCANCLPGETKIDQYTCSGSGNKSTRLAAQLVAEPVEEVESSTAAKEEKSFPTAIVAGLGVLIMVLSAVTGMICLRGREKTNTQQSAVAEAEVENKSPAQNDVQSFEHLTQVMEKAPTDESEKEKNSGSE